MEQKFIHSNQDLSNCGNQIYLLEEENTLSLLLKDKNNTEIMRLGILPISEKKKITNFFLRGFGLALENQEDLLIPEIKLMEKERKIIIPKASAALIQTAKEKLKQCYNGNNHRPTYERKVIYLDTNLNDFQNNHRILRITEEENGVVKLTIHFNNHLSGDEKFIVKFFCNHTNLEEVISFLEQGLGLKVITTTFRSFREEWETSFGDISIDDMEKYFVIELELDSFAKTNPSLKYINEKASEIGKTLGLESCQIVDLGTEIIYTMQTGVPFFEAFSNDTSKNFLK